jgi:hypothetical protein
MITQHAVSDDGLHWRDQGIVLQGTPGSWDARCLVLRKTASCL